MASAQPKLDFERLWAGLGSNRELAVPDGHTDDGSKNGSKSACNAQTGNSSRMKEALFPGLSEERMMGLEPTTFCMASRRSSQLSYIRVARASIARVNPRRGLR